MVSAQATGLMVRIIPVADNTATLTMKPSASPSLADVKAIRRRVTSAVEATVTFFKSSSPSPCIMKTPIITRAEVVATDGMIAITGVTNNASRKQIATEMLTRPVRPPCSTPAADSR